MGRAQSVTPDAIKDALGATRGFTGATGTMTIDASHNAIKPAVVVEVRGKKFVYAAQIQEQ
jgi:branched-chain amino acid transport system substrate-binding protein